MNRLTPYCQLASIERVGKAETNDEIYRTWIRAESCSNENEDRLCDNACIIAATTTTSTIQLVGVLGIKLPIRKWPLSTIAGITSIIIYLSFTMASYLLYPGSFSPFTNGLSELGNSSVNLSGAILYRLGGALAGLALIPFLLGFYRWYAGRGRVRNLLVAAQISGGVGAIALVMAGIFSIDNFAPHSFWSAIVFIAFDFFLALSGAALLYRPLQIRWLACFAIGAAIVDFSVGVFLNTFVGEWITVALLLMYVGLISYYFGEKKIPAKAAEKPNLGRRFPGAR